MNFARRIVAIFGHFSPQRAEKRGEEEEEEEGRRGAKYLTRYFVRVFKGALAGSYTSSGASEIPSRSWSIFKKWFRDSAVPVYSFGYPEAENFSFKK